MLAVAALAAGVVLTKTRQATDVHETDDQQVVEATGSLEKLRAAGF